jgi:hypothetical protein
MENNAKSKILDLSWGYLLSRAIYAAAKLNVADHLSNEPTDINSLANSIHADPRSLYRLLRMLASYGIFSESTKEHFVLTPMGKCLQSTGEDSIRDLLLGEEDRRWNAIGHLDLAVTNGKPSFDQLYGKNYFDYLATDPARSALFDAHMSSLTKEEDRLLLQTLEIKDANTIADIGGGRGSFLREVLKKHSSSQGILYDLPIVVESEALLLGEAMGRCQIIPGNFFDSAPKADVYLLKRVLHDWDDESCHKILSCIRKAMSKNSKIYVIETIIPENEDPHPSKDIDVFLMALFSGGERTLTEFTNLFTSQGLKIEKIHSTSTYLSILEIAVDS